MSMLELSQAGAFGATLREARKAAGLGLRELARRVPINPGYLCNVEHGVRVPSPEVAKHLDRALAAGGRLAAMVAPPLSVPEIIAARRTEAEGAAVLDERRQAGELDNDAYLAALTALTVTRFPVGYRLGQCPTWCSTDHAAAGEDERTEGMRIHEVRLESVPTWAFGLDAVVTVCAVDHFDEDRRGYARVVVSGAEHGLDKHSARRVALALLDGGDRADEWNATGRRR